MKRTAAAVRVNSDSAPHEARALTLDEIYPLYPGEWVLVRTVELDERGNIARAEVVAHSSSRKKVSEALGRVHREDPMARTYIFLGGQYHATVEEWREQLAEAARNPLNAGW